MLIEDALKNESISFQRIFVGEYKFYVGGLSKEITIRLYRNLDGTQVSFEQSHYIKTPLLPIHYTASISSADNEGVALHRAITSITSYYDEAIKKGNQPNDDWLVENEYF